MNQWMDAIEQTGRNYGKRMNLWTDGYEELKTKKMD